MLRQAIPRGVCSLEIRKQRSALPAAASADQKPRRCAPMGVKAVGRPRTVAMAL
jgi:hypothetical protein